MKIKLLILSLIAITIFGCNSNSSDDSASNVDSADLKFEDTLSKQKKDLIHFKFLTAISNLPSPFEMINVVYNNELPFNDRLINPIANADKYKTGFQKAYNYGSYGVDLSYIGFYGNKSNLLGYYNTVKSLATDLNLEKVFDDFAGKFSEYEDNKDSLVVLLDRAFSETDSYLRKYKRHLSASQVLAGSIIETHYLSVELMKNQDRTAANGDIYNRIYNHKLYFYHLLKLLEEFKSDKDAARLYDALKEYSDYFNSIVPEDSKLNKETMNQLSVKANELRNKFI